MSSKKEGGKKELHLLATKGVLVVVGKVATEEKFAGHLQDSPSLTPNLAFHLHSFACVVVDDRINLGLALELVSFLQMSVAL